MTTKSRLTKLEQRAQPQGRMRIYVVQPAMIGEQVAEAIRAKAANDPGAIVLDSTR